MATERVPSRVSITPPHSFSKADLITRVLAADRMMSDHERTTNGMHGQ